MQTSITLTLSIFNLASLSRGYAPCSCCPVSLTRFVSFLLITEPLSPPSVAGALYPLCTPAPQLVWAHPLVLGLTPSQVMWNGISSAGSKERVGKELGTGDRAEHNEVSRGNGFSMLHWLLSITENTSFLPACHFPLFPFFLRLASRYLSS